MIGSFSRKEMVNKKNVTDSIRHENDSDLDAAEMGEAVSFVDKIIPVI